MPQRFVMNAQQADRCFRAQSVIFESMLRFRLNHLFLLQFLQLGRDNHPAVGRVGIVVVVSLMIIPGRVKLGERRNLGDDGVLEIFLRPGL
jgi:hypothetical protein